MKQSLSYNNSSEDFALDRKIAEAEAIELLRERKLHLKKLKEEADKRTYAQAEAEAKRAESEAKKAEDEARKAEADARKAEEILKQRQMEAEQKIKKLKSPICSILGIAPAIIRSIMLSFININGGSIFKKPK